MGLSLPLEQFTFHITENKPLCISFDPRLPDNPNHWQFWLFKPTQHHNAALGISQKQPQPSRLVIKKVVPFRDEQPFSCPILHQTFRSLK